MEYEICYVTFALKQYICSMVKLNAMKIARNREILKYFT